MPRGVPKESICVRIDADVLLQVRHLLEDPLRKRTKHGSMSALIENLLLQWAASHSKAATEKEAK